jgi:hypothetical protein
LNDSGEWLLKGVRLDNRRQHGREKLNSALRARVLVQMLNRITLENGSEIVLKYFHLARGKMIVVLVN